MNTIDVFLLSVGNVRVLYLLLVERIVVPYLKSSLIMMVILSVTDCGGFINLE